MFPITDRRGRVIAFGGRILDQGEPKYLNSPDTPLFHKGRMLYGLARRARRRARRGELIVIEGYMDVIALAEAGIGDAVAPLGTALTEDQIDELWRLAPEPILCFDGDAAGPAGGRARGRAGPAAAGARAVAAICHPAGGGDPDSLIRRGATAAMAEALAQARPLVDVIWDQIGRAARRHPGTPGRPAAAAGGAGRRGSPTARSRRATGRK